MRLKYVLIILIVLASLTPSVAQEPTETPDVGATATQIIAEATQTAAAMPTATELVETDDPFILTATQLVRDVTLTAEAGDSQDSAVTPNESLFDVSEEEFGLTATQLIVDVTQTAQASPNTDENETNAGNSNSGGGCAPAVIMPMGLAFFGLTWAKRKRTV